MKYQYFKNRVFLIVFLLSGMVIYPIVHAQDNYKDDSYSDMDSGNKQLIQLVQNTAPQPLPAPAPGNQLFPGTNERNEREGKNCMTVCARWGEECTYTDRGKSGTTRDCRRTCQQFTEECF
jgi:hypothetical protein